MEAVSKKEFDAHHGAGTSSGRGGRDVAGARSLNLAARARLLIRWVRRRARRAFWRLRVRLKSPDQRAEFTLRVREAARRRALARRTPLRILFYGKLPAFADFVQDESAPPPHQAVDRFSRRVYRETFDWAQLHQWTTAGTANRRDPLDAWFFITDADNSAIGRVWLSRDSSVRGRDFPAFAVMTLNRTPLLAAARFACPKLQAIKSQLDGFADEVFAETDSVLRERLVRQTKARVVLEAHRFAANCRRELRVSSLAISAPDAESSAAQTPIAATARDGSEDGRGFGVAELAAAVDAITRRRAGGGKRLRSCAWVAPPALPSRAAAIDQLRRLLSAVHELGLRSKSLYVTVHERDGAMAVGSQLSSESMGTLVTPGGSGDSASCASVVSHRSKTLVARRFPSSASLRRRSGLSPWRRVRLVLRRLQYGRLARFVKAMRRRKIADRSAANAR